MKRNRRSTLRSAALIGAVIGLSISAAHPGDALAADKIRVGKAQGAAWTFLPVDAGVEQGLFAKNGIEVEIINLAGDAKVQQALAADSIEIGLGSGPGMAFAAHGGVAIGVAAFAGAPRNISATVLTDAPYKTVADLKGKKFSVSTAGSLSEWLVKALAIKEGWGPDGATTVPLGAIASSVAALRMKQVDAVMLATEAGFALEAKKEGRILVGMENYAPDFITHVVFAPRALVEKNPALIERFLKPFFASIAWVKTHKAETAALAKKVIGMEPEVANRVYDAEVAMFLDDGRFDPKAVAVLKQSYLDMGTLKEKPSDDQLFTTRFVPVKY